VDRWTGGLAGRGLGGHSGRVQSDAPDVDRYLEGFTGEWRTVLDRLRGRCTELLTGYEEHMAYGMPAYRRSGKVEISFAKQANYLSLYVLKSDVLDAAREDLAGADVGKGCVRYRRAALIDWAVVDRLLEATAASYDPPC